MKKMFYVMSTFVGFYLLFGVVEMYEESLVHDEKTLIHYKVDKEALIYDEDSMTYDLYLLEE